MSVVLTADLKDWRDWRPVGDLMSPLAESLGTILGLCTSSEAGTMRLSLGQPSSTVWSLRNGSGAKGPCGASEGVPGGGVF